MKTISLADQIQKAAARNRKPELWIPGERTYRTWPLCMTCGREVDSSKLENVSNRGCEIRVTCHGAEDSIHVTFPLGASDNTANPLDDKNVGWAVKRALHDYCPFDKSHMER